MLLRQVWMLCLRQSPCGSAGNVEDFCDCNPPSVDRIWGIWGSYYNIPEPIFYLLKRDGMYSA